MKFLHSVFVIFSLLVFVSCTDDGDNSANPILPVPQASAYKGFDIEKDFVPFNGEVTPMTENIRPVHCYDKRWLLEVVYAGTNETRVYTSEIVGYLQDNFSRQEWLVSTKYDDDYRTIDRGIYEYSGVIQEYFSNTLHYPNGTELLETFDINPVGLKIYNYGSQYDDEVVIISRGTITLMGKELRAVKTWMQHADKYSRPKYDYWVEGIGRLFGMRPDYSQTRILPTSGPWAFAYTRVLQCWVDEEKIYDWREFSEDLYHPVEIFTTMDQE